MKNTVRNFFVALRNLLHALSVALGLLWFHGRFFCARKMSRAIKSFKMSNASPKLGATKPYFRDSTSLYMRKFQTNGHSNVLLMQWNGCIIEWNGRGQFALGSLALLTRSDPLCAITSEPTFKV